MLRKYLIIAGGILIVLVILGIVFGNKKTITKTTVPASNTAYMFNSDYLRFNYLAKYTVAKVPTTDGRVFVNIKMTSNDGQMLLYLANATQELDQVSEVLMRRATTWQYTEEVARIGELRGLLFRTADKKERTVFFENKGQLLEITLTAPTNDQKYDQEFQTFLDGLNWNTEGF